MGMHIEEQDAAHNLPAILFEKINPKTRKLALRFAAY
jgi:hypothetical protein